MSLIEIALSKVQKREEERTGKPHAPSRRKAADDAARSTVVAARQFQPASLDGVVMERNCILPAMHDQAALRKILG